MSPLKGVSPSIKKDGSTYYRASITYRNKHISLGSYGSEKTAHQAYLIAYSIIFQNEYHYDNYSNEMILPFEKWIVLHNFRDNGYYIKNPIYMHKYYFSYFIEPMYELQFDVDDLFYYSTHKIFKREGYLFVNDFGIQMNILNRLGVKNFAIEGKDYFFKDNNPNNLRYHNIEVINRYYGVENITQKENCYKAKIHINGNYIIGKYKTEEEAAIAFNKAADFIRHQKISNKKFPRNYIDNLTQDQYYKIYEKIKISPKILRMEHILKKNNSTTS